MRELHFRVLDRTLVGDGCWIFQGAKATNGYGRVSRAGRGTGTVAAHVAVYEAMVGLVPDGHQLDHVKEKCSSKACCRPDHLEPVTQRENLIRGNGWAGRNARKTHCPQGHRLPPERGRCMVCKKAQDREAWARWKERHRAVDPG